MTRDADKVVSIYLYLRAIEKETAVAASFVTVIVRYVTDYSILD